MGKFSGYRPALAAFALMVSMAITTTALSFFVGPVCQELAIGRGRFLIYYSILTAAGTAAVPVLGHVIHKRGVRCILAVSAVWVFIGFFLFSLCSRVWMFYAVSAVMGLFGTACVSLCATVIVQKSYAGPRASGILGFVMSGSGVGGMGLSLVLPGLIQSLGWRRSYRFLGICWLCLGLLAFLLLRREAISGDTSETTGDSGGMTRAQALRTPMLYRLTAVMFLLSAACGIQTQLPSLLSGFGFGTGRVSAMVSFFTAALAAGKILQGVLYSKIGPIRGGYAVIVLFAGSFLLLQLPQFSYPALAMLAIGMGSVTTLMPVLTRSAFGSLEYAAIFSILSTTSNAGTLIAAPLFGAVFDRCGSYGPAMWVSFAALALCPLLLSVGKK